MDEKKAGEVLHRNPVVREIPEGAEVTVILRNGMRFTGTDDTLEMQADVGVFVLFRTNGVGARAMNHKTYLLADDIVGFEIEYD